MDLLLVLIALAALVMVAIFFRYGKKQSSKKVAAVALIRGMMQRTEGILAGIKPSISDPAMVSAINDGLAALAKATKQLETI
jgi:hypothetical protein